MVSNRQQHSEGGAFAWLALDFDPAAVGFDDHLAVEHTDADAFLFGGLERAKEGALNKLGRHAAAIVRHGHNHPAVALAGLGYLAGWSADRKSMNVIVEPDLP